MPAKEAAQTACSVHQAGDSANGDADQLFDGRQIGVLTLVDNHTRESLALHVGQRVRGMDVVRVLEGVVNDRGRPGAVRVDNGPEFISK